MVKENLISKKIINRTTAFDKVAKALKYDHLIKPGRFRIKSGMSMISLVRMLRSGDQAQVNFIINKVHTKEELAEKMGNNFEFSADAALQFMIDSASKFKLDSNNIMSLIIPDTYTFTWNNTPSKVFRKLYAAHERFWTAERKQKAANMHLKNDQVYTLASIVEEETTKNDDKGKIASVYINRLRKGMRLAADPTVKFALRDFSLTRIYNKHLSVSSPYNTYMNAGLPPGPICTPSSKTIDAVLNAPETNYLFFVAKADFSGYSNFASSFAQHNVYANEYRKALDSLYLSKNKNPDNSDSK